MTKATLEQARIVHLTLTRVSEFLATLSDADPSETNLLVTVSPPAEQAPIGLYDDDHVPATAYEEPVTLSSVDYVLPERQAQHPLVTEFYAELAGWLLERLPALEAELKQEFEAL